MERSNTEKGNIAAANIVAKLLGLAPDLGVHELSQQHDPNHWDIDVDLKGGSGVAQAKVQAKWFSEDNTRLKVSHIDDWLRAQLLTIPMWWDHPKQQVYWCDIFTFLVENGGFRGRGEVEITSALVPLDVDNEASRRSFLSWIRAFAKVWPLQYDEPEWLRRPEFPAAFADVLRNPDILTFLPVNADLVTAIRDAWGRTGPSLTRALFRAGAAALEKSPEHAVIGLAESYGIAESQVELRAYLVEKLYRWAERIGARCASTLATLKAFRQLVAVMCYERAGDVRFPQFAASHAYPFGALVQLLPASVAAQQLVKILLTDEEPNTLLFAAYALGLVGLDHQPTVISGLVRETRVRLRTRTDSLGPLWPLADRQLLYTEAQLGSEEARDRFLTALRVQGAIGFEVPFNYCYYGGDLKLIKYRYERRLDDNPPTDRATKDVILATYEGLRTALKAQLPTIAVIKPELWPVS